MITCCRGWGCCIVSAEKSINNYSYVNITALTYDQSFVELFTIVKVTSVSWKTHQNTKTELLSVSLKMIQGCRLEFDRLFVWMTRFYSINAMFELPRTKKINFWFYRFSILVWPGQLQLYANHGCVHEWPCTTQLKTRLLENKRTSLGIFIDFPKLRLELFCAWSLKQNSESELLGNAKINRLLFKRFKIGVTALPIEKITKYLIG